MEVRSVHSAVFVRYRAAFCLRRGRRCPRLRNRPLPVRYRLPLSRRKCPPPRNRLLPVNRSRQHPACRKKENPLIANGVLKSYDTGKQKNVVLPGGKFTKISSGCFKNNTTMESVSIPEGVTEIGFAAFSGCYNLKSVQLQNR